MNHTQESGQTLLEACFGIFISGILFFGTAKVLMAQWQRTRCSYLVFEATLRASYQHSSIGIPRLNSVYVTEDKTGFFGTGKCGSIEEKLFLPKLEHGKWR